MGDATKLSYSEVGGVETGACLDGLGTIDNNGLKGVQKARWTL